MPILNQALEETQMKTLYDTIELPLVYVLEDMEKFGIKVQKEALHEYGQQLGAQIKSLEASIYQLAGETFNINSPKQLGVILFEKLKLPYGKKTKTGYSTSAEVLEKLKGEDPIIKLVLEYRQLTKLKSTYADGLEGFISSDHRIHGKFNQTITATGRISSTEPNLQNIPIRMELGRLIRKVFVPEDGYVFVDADYSQIELRVLAHMSGDEALIQAYKEAMDIHRMTASQVFHTPFDQVTDEMRRNAKAVNFGIVYGISSFGLSQDLSITRKEAQNYIQKYFKTYPKVKSFLDQAVENAKNQGYSVTMFSRRRPIPELQSKNFAQRSFGERIAMNSPIQGTAADIIKIAMINVSRALKAKNLKSKLILQVHDELLIEAWESETGTVIEILDREMKRAAALAVPLEIDVHTGHIIVADEVARKLSMPGGRSYQKIVDYFGGNVLDGSGQIDRGRLAQIVFHDKALLEKLNSFTHPIVKEEILAEIDRAQKEPMCRLIVIESAIFIGAGYEDICDEFWLVYTDPDLRRQRMKESRGYSDEKVDSIMKNQPDDDLVKKACQRVIINNTTLDDVRAQISEILDDAGVV